MQSQRLGPLAGRLALAFALSLALLGGAVAQDATAPATPAAPDAAQAEQAPADDDPVVARLNGEEIRVSDVVASARDLPPQYQQQLELLFTPILNRLINQKLLSQAADDAGLGEDPELQRRLAEQRAALLRDLYLERKVEEAVTEEALASRYETFVAEFEGEEEAHASHILLKTEDEAKAVIAELDGGADFAELAKTKSEDPAGRNGGDLGFFTREAMVAEFSDAAFAMEPGTYSKAPVQSQFGWHVIRLEEKRVSSPPPFEEVRAQLDEELSRETIQGLVEAARKGAEIVILDPSSGEPLPPEGEAKPEGETQPAQ